MNVFPLDNDFKLSAEYHVDKHIIKIPLECAQMMSTACRFSGIPDVGYKSTHVNHPMTKWVRECMDNFIWMFDYAKALNDEYKYRYGKIVNHKAFDVIFNLPIPNLPMYGVTTPMPLCMPENCKVGNDPVRSYRNYYLREKLHLGSWKKRGTPGWIITRDLDWREN